MSLVLTRIQNLRAKSDLDKFEIRPSRYGALDCFMVQDASSNSIVTPELRSKARESIGSVLETPVIDYDGGITIGNTRSLTISDSENTSRMVTINFATYSWGFTITPAMYMNNEISMQRDFEVKMLKYIYALGAALDSAALAALAAAKTSVFANSLLYDTTGGDVAATWSQRENMFGDLNVLMAANDFFGPLHIVGDSGVESTIKKLAQKDLYNVENKRNEYNDKIFHFTNSLTADPSLYAQGYAVMSGSLGMLTRFERDCILKSRSGDGHEWDTTVLPVLGLPCGTYFYDSVGDYSAIAGAATADMVRSRKEHYGFAVDVAFLTAYNSAPTGSASPKASPIMGFTIGNTNAEYGLPVYNVN